jgi:hypothetical protein
MRIKFLEKIFLAVVTSVGAITVGLIEAHVWRPPVWYSASAIAAGVVAALASAVWAAVEEAIARKKKWKRDQINGLIETLFFVVDTQARQMNVNFSSFDLGIAVWKTLKPDAAVGSPLHCVHRKRARHRHFSSGIDWTVGKGVIGLCIESGEPLSVDLNDEWSGYRSCTRSSWVQLDEGIRQRLTFDEFKKLQGSPLSLIKNHFRFLLAVPVFDKKGRILGCVAVDGSSDGAPVITSAHVVNAVNAIADFEGTLRKEATYVV